MKKLLFLLTFSVFYSNLFAQKNVQEAIKFLETKRFEAQVNRDEAVLKEILADDLVYIHSNASVDTKENFIKNLITEKSTYKSIVIESSEVRVYQNTAVVTGKGIFTVVSAGKENPLQLRYTDVYVKKNKKWQMVSWNSVRLPVQ